uniref:Myo-inositol oxygenase n=1 Tax=Marseillevirus LCMAC103 TaxID=2506604 RepID=A0A481YUU5_9VIRU|nr:MAG: myo-inositol oxygenase [Marseillevirus LCMAC103]
MRNFDGARPAVRQTYAKMRQRQTLAHARRMVDKYCAPRGVTLGIWDALARTNAFVDLSDPDVDLPNFHHLVQTADALRKAGAPGWLQVVGLIHDLGKILCEWGCDADGTSLAEQWSLVGDTFAVGCRLPGSAVYPEFNELHPDRFDQIGIYSEGVGMMNLQYSFGHDEYLYRVLRANETKLPEEAFYVIRLHSLYPWHTGGDYAFFENDYDRENKHWVQYFNRFDLYSKENVETDVDKEYYGALLQKYGLMEIAF